MSEKTISFTEKGRGFTSFHSFIPDCMVNMNNSFYSFKNGELYLHYDNEKYNNYYGVDYPSEVTVILNDGPTEEKYFKTIGLEGTSSWDATITTDLDEGFIDNTYFKLKEGTYYSHIRRNSGSIDLSSLSTHGVGIIAGVGGTTVQFGFDIQTKVVIGDELYVSDGNTSTLVGTVTNYSDTSITVDAFIDTPTAGDLALLVRNSVAESRGVRGHYMELKLTNEDTTEVELLAISSEIDKSYP